MSFRTLRFAVAVSLFAAGTASAQDTWTSRTPIPEPVYAQGGGVVGGKIYMFGGMDPTTGAILTKTWEYDPATDLWTEKTPMPAPIAAMGTATVGDVIYCIGGTDPTGLFPITSVYAYDPAMDTWTSKASMPTPRWLTSCGAIGGKIYVCGGEIYYTSGEFAGLYDYSDVVEEYDPLMDTWTTKASMTIAVSNAFEGVVRDKLYVVGGFSGIPGAGVLPGNEFSNVSRSTLEYDPATDAWTVKSPMPDEAIYGIYAGQSAVLGDQLFCFGGEYIFTMLSAPPTYEYTPSSDTWAVRAAPPTWPTWSWAIGAGGKAYMMGPGIDNLEYTPLASPYVAPTLSDLAQRDVAGGAIPLGAQAPAVIRFQALIADPDSDAQLEVEIRAVNDPYTDVPTATGDFMPAGLAFVEFSTSALASGDYKWRARAVDENGNRSDWTSFGTTNPDFVVVAAVSTPPPSGGDSKKKGGCSSSVPGGAATLAPALLLALAAVLRRR